jgi:hypothetical protein
MVACADCGKQCQRARPQRGWTPPVKTRCRRCSYAIRQKTKPKICACGQQMYWESKMCQLCRRSQFGEPGAQAGRKAGRKAWHTRSQSAPGLPRRARRALLIKWKRQGRSCAYCLLPCEAIDHIVPLIRGGTNYEGNLAPVCHPCNLAKGQKLLIVWRYSRLTRKIPA